MTKGELASRILKMIGINTRVSSADPEEISDTLLYVEDWMLANNAVGRRIGWVEADGTPNPSEDAGIPSWAVMGVTNKLAEYVAPYFDKQVHPSIVRNGMLGMQIITNRTVEVQDVQYPERFPRGHSQGSPFSNKFYHQEDRIKTFNDFLTDEGDEPITS